MYSTYSQASQPSPEGTQPKMESNKFEFYQNIWLFFKSIDNLQKVC